MNCNFFFLPSTNCDKSFFIPCSRRLAFVLQIRIESFISESHSSSSSIVTNLSFHSSCNSLLRVSRALICRERRRRMLHNANCDRAADNWFTQICIVFDVLDFIAPIVWDKAEAKFSRSPLCVLASNRRDFFVRGQGHECEASFLRPLCWPNKNVNIFFSGFYLLNVATTSLFAQPNTKLLAFFGYSLLVSSSPNRERHLRTEFTHTHT